MGKLSLCSLFLPEPLKELPPRAAPLSGHRHEHQDRPNLRAAPVVPAPGRENIEAVRDRGWHFLCRARPNRRVNPDRQGNRPIDRLTDRGGRDDLPPGRIRVGQAVPDRHQIRRHGVIYQR